MTRSRTLAATVALGAAFAALAFSRSAAASTGGIAYLPSGEGELPMGDGEPPADLEAPTLIDYETVDWLGFPLADPPVFVDTLDPDAMIDAFLYMVRSCEHVFPRDVSDDTCYRIFYGGAEFFNMSDHPALTGEKRGVPLPRQMCINAGYASGNCVSTAAGAYQINVPTWREVRSWGGDTLPDFSRESQDEAARRILRKIGATPLIVAGDIEAAIQKASKRWASLPGSTAKQSPKPVAFALARYNEAVTA